MLIARWLLAALLFAQGALAAYACPALTSALDSSAAIAQAAAMPADCDRMNQAGPMALDLDAPNICLAHCQSGQQSHDHPEAPTALPVMDNVLIVAVSDLGAWASSPAFCSGRCGRGRPRSRMYPASSGDSIPK